MQSRGPGTAQLGKVRVVSPDRLSWRQVSLGGGSILAAPAAFAFFRARPEADLLLGSPTYHFWIVSGIAALALVMAVAVLRAASSLPDARTFFLAMGFLSMATIFLAHGVGTSPLFPGSPHVHAATNTSDAWSTADSYPGLHGYGAPADVDDDGVGAAVPAPDATFLARLRVVGYSAQLSLFVSAIFFALATLSLPPWGAAFFLRHRTGLTGAISLVLVGHVVLALAFPQVLSHVPLDSDPLKYGIASASILALGFAAWRFFEAHRLALLPLQGAMALGMVLLIEAQYFMLASDVWRLSWWEYHLAMLLGFSVCVGALLRQHRITGDLGAIVEGLFLRENVRGLRHGDPRALGALSAALTAKDTETADHTERVGNLTVAVGERMGLPASRMVALRWAGQLHDVGKIGVPNSILRKASALSREEFEIIKQHSVRGWHLASRSELLASVALIIRAHHERMDGKGYPDGLAGREIPFEARIVAVADVWDALSCDRPYRAAMNWQEAGKILTAGAGEHFDADCVEALLEVLGLPDLSRFLANDLPEAQPTAA